MKRITVWDANVENKLVRFKYESCSSYAYKIKDTYRNKGAAFNETTVRQKC